LTEKTSSSSIQARRPAPAGAARLLSGHCLHRLRVEGSPAGSDSAVDQQPPVTRTTRLATITVESSGEFSATRRWITPHTVLAVLGTPEIIIIVVVVVMLFGATQLPKLARSLGASAKEFRKGVQQGEEEADSQADSKSQADGKGPGPALTASLPTRQPSPPTPQIAAQTVAQQLKDLAELRASGILTEEEFEAQKRKLLSGS
jgi:sec-independent protein translocase protein TatA